MKHPRVHSDSELKALSQHQGCEAPQKTERVSETGLYLARLLLCSLCATQTTLLTYLDKGKKGKSQKLGSGRPCGQLGLALY